MPRLQFTSGGAPTPPLDLRNGVNRLGRSEANDLQINDLSISGAHCEIICDNDRVFVRDLGSTNGTFVDGQPVQEAWLQPGQSLRLGSVEMTLAAPLPPISIPKRTAASPAPPAGPELLPDGSRGCAN